MFQAPHHFLLLCHISSSYLKTLSSNGQLELVNYEAFDYMPCQLDKYVNLSFNNNDSIISILFDLIHLGIWEPTSITTMGQSSLA